METREQQLRKWIAEAEAQLEKGLPLNQDGEQMTMQSTEMLLEMWREELARVSQ